MSWFRDNLEDTEYRLHTRYCKPGAGALDQLHPCHPLVAELMTGALQLRLTGGTSQGQSHTPGGPTVSLQSPEWRESVGRDGRAVAQLGQSGGQGRGSWQHRGFRSGWLPTRRFCFLIRMQKNAGLRHFVTALTARKHLLSCMRAILHEGDHL
jgi:hypothetical protein